MFSNHEELICGICKKVFIGRKPAEGGCSFCPECLSIEELPIVTDGDIIPHSVHEELVAGEGSGENG